MKTHRGIFYQALLHQDWRDLAELYADDYILVRSNGDALTKAQVLTDLKMGDLVFKSIELMNERVRIVGSTAILTGESRTTAERKGVITDSHFRLVAIYVGTKQGLRLSYFQSTDIPPTEESTRHIKAILDRKEIA